MSFAWQRKRVAPGLTNTDVTNVLNSGPYQYHMGDVLTPGASAWVYVEPLELQPISVFGRGGVASVCCRKYSFDFRAQQLGNVPTVVLKNSSNGGAYVGTFGLTSLIPDQSANLG